MYKSRIIYGFKWGKKEKSAQFFLFWFFKRLVVEKGLKERTRLKINYYPGLETQDISSTCLKHLLDCLALKFSSLALAGSIFLSTKRLSYIINYNCADNWCLYLKSSLSLGF